MTDLGSDIYCVSGVDPAYRVVSGRVAHAQAIARRLGTPRGALARIGDDPDYGYDVRAFVGDDVGPRVVAEVTAGVEREALQDERTADAKATVTVAGGALVISLRIVDGDGPFSLVLAVSDVTVSVLKVT